MNATSPARPRLSARRMALLATTITGFGAAAFFAPQAPNADFFSAPAHAQNLTHEAQQLPQKPVGFADIVEKVKPAVIAVRVKMEGTMAEAGPSDDELPVDVAVPAAVSTIPRLSTTKFKEFTRIFTVPSGPAAQDNCIGNGGAA